MIGGWINMLFSVNSCVNPFIYAQTIPAFKLIILNLFSSSRWNKRSRNIEERNEKALKLETDTMNENFDNCNVH